MQFLIFGVIADSTASYLEKFDSDSKVKSNSKINPSPQLVLLRHRTPDLDKDKKC